MKYKKGNQAWAMNQDHSEGVATIQIRLCGFSEDEIVTAKTGDWTESALMEHAFAFAPYPSWGVIIPSAGPPFAFWSMLESGELTLHPFAWDQYLRQGIIDDQGNYIQPEDRKEIHVT